MKFTKYIILICFLIVVLGFAYTSNSDEEGKELWKKAVRIAAKNGNWVPGLTTTKTILKNKKGKVKSDVEVWIGMEQNDKNKIKSTLIKYIKNGEDLTEKNKYKFSVSQEEKGKEPESKKKSSFSVDLNDSPFNPKLQDKVSFKATKKMKFVDGHEYQVFSYRQKIKINNQKDNNPVVRVGEVWLERALGIPIQVQFTLNPLPGKIKEFSQKIQYRFEESGDWYPKQVEIKGMGGILFIKRFFSSTIQFSKFFKYSKPEEQE